LRITLRNLIAQENEMRDIPRNVAVQPASMLNVGTRMMQIGHEQVEAVLGLQAKRTERDRTAVQHACEALLQAGAGNVGGFLQTWQMLVREYLAASVALWNLDVTVFARNQAAYGAWLREVVVDCEKAWVRAPAQMAQQTQQAGTVPQAGDWMTCVGRFMGGWPDGEAKPEKPARSATTASA
jgi:hypothetical protein